MKKIGVVSVARSDYGIYLPLLKGLHAHPDFDLSLIVTGMHLSRDHGMTVKMIEEDRFNIVERVEMELSSDQPSGIVNSMGVGLRNFSKVYSRFRPDLLIVLGDRFEMYTAALATLPFRIPLAHVHGGELTLGAIDDTFRHSLTKLSHLHFTATQTYANRVIQLGEEPWRVTVSGAPALDNLHQIALLNRSELEQKYRLRLSQSPLVVTFHPVTLEYDRTDWQIDQLLQALGRMELPIVFTAPNADTSNRTIAAKIATFVEKHPHSHFVADMGLRDYWSLLSISAAMVGNSSSGLLEAPSFKLPVVNIGTRQGGRIRAENVIDVGYESTDIVQGIEKALSKTFRAKLEDLKNPYGDGHATERIIKKLETISWERLLSKEFHDIPSQNK